MSVYVDDAFIPYRGMRMCHLMADTPEELRAMGARLGLRPEWVQRPGERLEHFDVSAAKRAQAVAYGAIPLTRRELARKLR